MKCERLLPVAHHRIPIMSSDIGVFGMGVMGQSLAMNIASKGFRVTVTNRSTSPLRVSRTLDRARAEGLERNVAGALDSKEFIKTLSVPRKVIILVPAGKAVDAVIEELSPELECGDILIDGGNEWYEHSIRRAKDLQEVRRVHYIGMGISGGEEGARNGPCLMPGGTLEAFYAVQNILEKCCAHAEGLPCMTYIGPIGSGNYVKMIHNGLRSPAFESTYVHPVRRNRVWLNATHR